MNYVIIGAGPAGVVAAETLRRLDPAGAVTLIGEEPEPPYSRMAIPYLMAGDVGEDGTHLRHGAGHFEGLGIVLRQDRVASIAPDAKTVALEGGETLAYDRLLIATGSRAARPPIPGMDLPGVETCWTLEDARKIAARMAPGKRAVLMGAGFIGCIVLQALAERDLDVTVVEMATRMLPRMMDETGGAMIARWCGAQGVTVRTGTQITGIEAAGDGFRLGLKGGEALEADLVICATGVTPNIGFLEGSGIATEAGVLADRHLETNRPGIYAAGDVAQGPDFSTGENAIHAIQPTATEHGRIAAANMAAPANQRPTRYRGSLSMNVLNTLGLISSSFGLWMGADGPDSDPARAQAVDLEGFKYLRLEFDGEVLVGALALGLTQHVGVIRGLIQSRTPLGPWKDRLLADPHLVMEAYLECVQGGSARG